MREVLVTGATGFIGRHLCRWLSSRGFSVVASARSGDLAAHRRIELERPEEFDAALRGIQAVVHLAARVHVMRDSVADPMPVYRRLNTEATALLAQSAARRGVERFIFLSTVKVNGERTDRKPFTEKDPPSPADPYGISKWEAEQELGRIAAQTGMRVAVLRPPLVYGPGVKGNFLRLLRLVRAGVPLPVARVNNARSMVYVGNLASAVERALVADPASLGTFLVSDASDVSTPELVRLLASAMGRRARLFALPPRVLAGLARAVGKQGEMGRMVESLRVDCSKIKQRLQWDIPFTVEQGLRETADWFSGARYRT